MSKGKEEKSKVTQSQIAMIDFSEKAIVEFGDYTNNKRHMPGLYDGCKPSYRRVIYTTMEFPDKMVKVMTLSGKCSGQYSPHKSESLNDVISNLVRIGVLDGQGGHGSKAILKEHCKEAAAPRYIEAKLNKNWRDMMDPLMKYVDWSMSELNYREPDFLPSPVPISLIHGSLGIGIGIKSNIPHFSFGSILAAHINDDPNLLMPGTDIILNKRKSQLHKIWDTGQGKISYMFKIDEDATSIDGETKGFLLYGDPRVIQVSINKGNKKTKSKMEDWIDKGLVIMREESGRFSGYENYQKKLFFSVKPRQRQVTMEMLRQELEILRYHEFTYKVGVTDGSVTRVLPLKTWIMITNNKYNQLVDAYKDDHIKKFQMDIDVLAIIPAVVKLLQKDQSMSNEAMAEEIGTTIELVNKAMSKPIRFLRNVDVDAEILRLKDLIETIKSIIPEDFYENLL